MSILRRAGSLLLLIALALLLVFSLGDLEHWIDGRVSTLLDSTNTQWLTDREPPASVPIGQLSRYTRNVAGEERFQNNFIRMAYGDEGGADSYSGRITKWDKRRVRVAILNDPGPGMTVFVRDLIAQVNAIQDATTFRMVDGAADITLRFVAHADYVRAVPRESVGHCEVSYYLGRSSMISAAITIDGGALKTPDERKPVVIHEFTHAIGFRGHLHDPRDSRSSVLYYGPRISAWTKDDRAAIRILYSSTVRSGMAIGNVRSALDRIATR